MSRRFIHIFTILKGFRTTTEQEFTTQLREQTYYKEKGSYSDESFRLFVHNRITQRVSYSDYVYQTTIYHEIHSLI